jgi:hypothetical protein
LAAGLASLKDGAIIVWQPWYCGEPAQFRQEHTGQPPPQPAFLAVDAHRDFIKVPDIIAGR